MNVNLWEVWLAKIKFEDSNQIKKRPVLIIDNNEAFLLSLKMTGTPPRNNFYGEYQLKYWQKAGLTKETTVRVSKKLKLFDTDIVHKIGKLSSYDILNIQKLLLNEMK